jgi:hypothetical protein
MRMRRAPRTRCCPAATAQGPCFRRETAETSQPPQPPRRQVPPLEKTRGTYRSGPTRSSASTAPTWRPTVPDADSAHDTCLAAGRPAARQWRSAARCPRARTRRRLAGRPRGAHESPGAARAQARNPLSAGPARLAVGPSFLHGPGRLHGSALQLRRLGNSRLGETGSGRRSPASSNHGHATNTCRPESCFLHRVGGPPSRGPRHHAAAAGDAWRPGRGQGPRQVPSALTLRGLKRRAGERGRAASFRRLRRLGGKAAVPSVRAERGGGRSSCFAGGGSCWPRRWLH